MRSPQFVIGIDGGGTKTLGIISDLHGNVIAQHVSVQSKYAGCRN